MSSLFSKYIFLLLGVLFFGSAVLWTVIWHFEHDSGVRVVFFNVGQGDAILVSQGNNQILIDGGKDSTVLLDRLGHFMPFWDRTIETVIATHPDQDHIGGLVGVFSAYKVDTVFESGASSDSVVSKRFSEVAREFSRNVIEAQNGMQIAFPNGAVMDIVYPRPDVAATATNDRSIVSRLLFGKHSFLFTGDLPEKYERYASRSPAEILKVGHHGSKYSTGEALLDSVHPKEAVISVGKNSYGHPSSEVVDRLRNRGISLWRTDESGSIEYICMSLETDCRKTFVR